MISYKEFSKNPSITQECYKEFYFELFPHLLLEYYPDRNNPDKNTPYSFIKSAARNSMQNIKLGTSLIGALLNLSSEQQYFFFCFSVFRVTNTPSHLQNSRGCSYDVIS